MSPGRTVRVATLNLCSGRGPDGTHLTASALSGALAALDADLVSLQEVDRDQPRSGDVDQAAVAADAAGAVDWRFAPTLVGTHAPSTPGTPRSWTPSPAVTVGAGDPGPRTPRFGVALLSRRPVTRWEVLPLGTGRAALPLRVPDAGTGRSRLLWFPDEPRVALAAVLEGLTVIGTHLSFAPPTSWRQLGLLRRWAATLPGPVVLAGDLNLPGPVVARRSGGRLLARTPTFPGADPRLQLDHVVALESGARFGAGSDPGPSGLRGSGADARQLDVGDHRALTVDVTLER